LRAFSDTEVGLTWPPVVAIQRGSVPNTPEEFAAAYLASEIAKAANRELDEHLADSARLEAQTQEFKEAVAEEKAKGAGKNNPYVRLHFPHHLRSCRTLTSALFTQSVSLWTQVKACTVRQYQLIWNDKGSIMIKQGSCIIQSIILGSLFYNLPQNTNGLFTRGGAIFFILLFNALLGMTEVTSSFDGRAILAKHKAFSMYRCVPSTRPFPHP
jgi:ATP-binding cassette subfamily G (WHITE) protein 2 (SNQ2)